MDAIRRRGISAAIAVCISLVASPGGEAAMPSALQRPDWADDDVIQAESAGGPDCVPQRLHGIWRVSLCVKEGYYRGHAWIRYENIQTGEVHTVGRFQKHVRPTKRRSTGEVLYPRTAASGLHWDYDWRFEHDVREGKYVVDTVLIRDPWIFEHDDPYGHRVLRDNCITYARDAWQYYSGQRFDLSLVHTPEGFMQSIAQAGDEMDEPAALARCRGENSGAAAAAQFSPNSSPSAHTAALPLRRLPPVQ